jgi:hypothetical protein
MFRIRKPLESLKVDEVLKHWNPPTRQSYELIAIALYDEAPCNYVNQVTFDFSKLEFNGYNADGPFKDQTLLIEAVQIGFDNERLHRQRHGRFAFTIASKDYVTIPSATATIGFHIKPLSLMIEPEQFYSARITFDPDNDPVAGDTWCTLYGALYRRTV